MLLGFFNIFINILQNYYLGPVPCENYSFQTTKID